ncbi:MAG: Lrp/AsnC ligand binding domain-containing protein [Nocardioidaceae bacterium]
MDKIPEVAETLAALDGVSEVYSVTGQIDLVAMVRVRTHEEISDVVADAINKVPGVTETETLSLLSDLHQHDLETIQFGLGLTPSL